MPWMKAANGNTIHVADTDNAARLLKRDGVTAYATDPRKGRAKQWRPGSDDAPDSTDSKPKGKTTSPGARGSVKSKAPVEPKDAGGDGATSSSPELPADGAPAAAWAAYADAVGVTYPADASRDEIRDRVKAGSEPAE